ncbi:MAG: PorV/PorQ family protein [candidate division Zixibacteria bacterium]|nr:PorV/PorQ family protein [candidate division Zixibacteria bacterium]
MKPLKLLIMLTLAMTFCLSIVIVSETKAEISNAAVLFLRIAPGARPAAMGEAYVAISDDPFAMYWNPAGLGSYPLADSWKEASIPVHLRPIKALAALKKDGGGSGHLAYDIWAITPKGMVRYDNKNWNLGEVFSTRTDETLVSKVRSYFNISDGEQFDQIVKKVAAINSKKTFEYLQNLHDSVLAAVPESYNLRESLQNDFDSLLAVYDRLLINWSKVKEIEDNFKKGMKDGQLSEQELDRLSFAVEKSRNRFIPEEISIPYSAVLDGEPFDIAASAELLLVATTANIYAFDGRRWRPLQKADDTAAFTSVNTLYGMDRYILVGTDKGLLQFSGAKLKPVVKSDQLPSGNVTAIGGADLNDIWIVQNNDLYHFNGVNWRNTREYTVVIDDTPESIAEKFSVYGTASENEIYIAKLIKANQGQAVESKKSEELGERKGLLELMQEMNAPVDSNQTEDEAVDSVGIVSSVEELTSEGSEAVASTEDTFVAVDANDDQAETVPEPAFTLKPGEKIRVPYLAEVKGDVNAILVERGNIWLGTEYGVIHFDGDKWNMPGYSDNRIDSAITITALIESKSAQSSYKMSAANFAVVNGIDGDIVESGSIVKLPKNPAASQVNEISRREDKVYFATSDGLIEYDGEKWRRSDLRGMDRSNAIDIRSIGEELWVASDDKIVVKANGQSDFSMMYVKWLPELADDLYYMYGSGVFPVSGWGTLGLAAAYISYGKFTRTGETGPQPLGEFDSFDFAVSASFGAPLTPKMAFGVTGKFIYSKLSDQGAGIEQGKGTSSGFAIDLGLLYHMNSRLTLGLAVTNLGPQMTYIDAAQSDDLPRNLGLGFAYKLMRSEYYSFLITAEVNKLLVGVDLKNLGQELEETVFNGGAEFMYAGIFAIRTGYIYDQEGKVKSLTLGAGLKPLPNTSIDFSYIPSNSSSALSNTLRYSFSMGL